MLISVIIPTYNRERVIERSINSVLNQTIKSLELIIVDDCSTDNTEKIVKNINDSRIKYIKLKKNSGACFARNKGIDEAKGNYIAFQDSDDEWFEKKLELQLKAIIETAADIVFCSFNRFEYGNTKNIIYPKLTHSHLCSNNELILNSLVSTQTILGKKQVFNKIKFNNSLPRLQDYDFIIRASMDYSIYYLGECLVNVYLQQDSITANKNEHRKIKEITLLLLDEHKDLANENKLWELKMLKTLAHCQVMLNENATPILIDIYKKEKNAVNFLKIMINKLRLLKFILNCRSYRLNKIQMKWRLS